MRWENFLWATAALTVSVGWLSAGDRAGCGHCGSDRPVLKVCKAVCETKKVVETKYSVACEDFCVPGPSEKCGDQWLPGCAEVRTKRKPVKTEITKEVPTWKWVVEYRCRTCCEGRTDLLLLALGQEPPATPPLPPMPDASRKSASGELDPPTFIRSTGPVSPAPQLRR